jgi:hypothetical protein
MGYPLDDEATIGRVYLETDRVSYRLMGGFMQAKLKLTEERDYVLGQMVYELATYVRTHRLPPETVEESSVLACDHPATWWQQWKQDVAAKHWVLRWITHRWPVRLTCTVHKLTVTLDLRRFRYYPDAPDISSVAGYETYFLSHSRSADYRWDNETGGN